MTLFATIFLSVQAFLKVILDHPVVNNSQVLSDKTVVSSVSDKSLSSEIPEREVLYSDAIFYQVNLVRNRYGVKALVKHNDLCTVTALRLQELISRGGLDEHKGFKEFNTNYPHLANIVTSYSSISEFLALGGKTPVDVVSLWEHSPSHKRLVTDDSLHYGCISAQGAYAVAIAAY